MTGPATPAPPPEQPAVPAPSPVGQTSHRPPPTTAPAMLARPAGHAAGAAIDTSAIPAVAVPEADAPVPEAARPGTVYDSRPPQEPGGDRGLGGRMARLHTGWQAASPGALLRLGPATSAAGLVLGLDQHRRPVAIRLFRPEPVRLALVGGAWLGRLLVVRALAFGARVAVVTTDPQPWQGLGEQVTGRRDRVRVLATEQPFAFAAAAAHQPILFVYDLGASTPAASGRSGTEPAVKRPESSGTASLPPRLGGWQSQITVLRRLDRPGVPALQESQLVLLQRLPPEQAALAGTALHLPGQTVQLLQSVPGDQLVVLERHTERFVRVEPTEVERRLIGISAPAAATAAGPGAPRAGG